MYSLKIAFLLLFAIGCCNADAQTKKNKQAVETQHSEQTSSDGDGLLYKNMLESTQKIFVIDSLVVDKQDFLSHIPIPKECGTVVSYDRFFKTSGHNDCYVYVNELGNKAYFSLTNKEGQTSLYTTDKLNNKWAKATRVAGLDSKDNPNFPFMMADGTTLFFSKQGENSVGGYDIFVTRYDSESGKFLKANNLGLPFNSKANDYFYMENELDSLGWFVTDRHQSEGKVCIYTFVPSKKRQNLDLSDMDEKQIRDYADLRSIKDTWPSENAHDIAMQRLQNMKVRAARSRMADKSLFVINDRVSYTSSSDFKSPDARKMYIDLLQARERLQAESKGLESLREQYASADDGVRSELTSIILEKEQELETLTISIAHQEKAIRNTENIFITK